MRLLIFVCLFWVFGCTTSQVLDISIQESTPEGYVAIKWEHLDDTPCLSQCFNDSCYSYATKACGKILLKEI